MEQRIGQPSSGKDNAKAGVLLPEVSGKIRTKRSILIDEWTDTLLMVFGIVVAFGFTPLCEDVMEPFKWKTKLLAFCMFGGSGFTLLAWVVHVANPSLLPNLLLRRAARRQIKSRSDRIVDPDDPEARFVEEIPEKRRNKPSLRGATEVGFLKVDRQQGMVLFEGDKMRYWIPAKSIVNCRQNPRSSAKNGSAAPVRPPIRRLITYSLC